MIEEITFRELIDFNDYNQIESIQQNAWEVPDRDLCPKRLPYATVNSGGVVIGAYKGDQQIGYVWAWVGLDKQNGKYLYSHHNAVIKEFQNKGIGFQLKKEQRKWALKNGFNIIKWVFDPLQTKNCYLNIHKLGAICNTYKINYWLELQDNLNKGIDTDRLFCKWELDSEHVENRLEENYCSYGDVIFNPDCQVLETQLEEDFVKMETKKWNLNQAIISLEVPSNFIEMKTRNKPLAIDWRMLTREAFLNYFNKGYTLVDFLIDKEQHPIRCYHILKK